MCGRETLSCGIPDQCIHENMRYTTGAKAGMCSLSSIFYLYCICQLFIFKILCSLLNSVHNSCRPGFCLLIVFVTLIYTFTNTAYTLGTFFKYTRLVPCWSPLCLQNSLAFKRCIQTLLNWYQGTKRVPGKHPQTITPPPPACTIDTVQNGAMDSCCLCQILTAISMTHQKPGFVRSGIVFQLSCPLLMIVCPLEPLCLVFS